MIISMDVENVFEKTQHPFMIKTLNKVGTEGTILNEMKVICDKSLADIIFSR